VCLLAYALVKQYAQADQQLTVDDPCRGEESRPEAAVLCVKPRRFDVSLCPQGSLFEKDYGSSHVPRLECGQSTADEQRSEATAEGEVETTSYWPAAPRQ